MAVILIWRALVNDPFEVITCAASRFPPRVCVRVSAALSLSSLAPPNVRLGRCSQSVRFLKGIATLANDGDDEWRVTTVGLVVARMRGRSPRGLSCGGQAANGGGEKRARHPRGAPRERFSKRREPAVAGSGLVAFLPTFPLPVAIFSTSAFVRLRSLSAFYLRWNPVSCTGGVSRIIDRANPVGRNFRFARLILRALSEFNERIVETRSLFDCW